MFRLVSVFVVLACAGTFLFAQGAGGGVVHNFSGSFNTNNFRDIRIDVDYGPTPQPATVDITMTLTSGPGFLIDLYDWDGHVAGAPNVKDNAQVMSGASSVLQLTTVARTGVHPMVLRLTDLLNLGQKNDYDGLILLSGATVVEVSESDAPYNTAVNPVRGQFGELQASYAAYNNQLMSPATLVRIDLGANGQAVDLRFDCSGMGVSSIVVGWPDGSGGRLQLIVNADASGNIHFIPTNPIRQLPVPAQSGLIEVTVIVNGAPGFSHADWSIYVPGGVEVLSMGAPDDGSGGTGSSGSCSTGEGGQLWLLLVLIASLGVPVVHRGLR